MAVLGLLGALLVLASPAAAQTDSPLPAGCDRLAQFDPAQFGTSTVIDNEYLPLTPGTQLVLEGRETGTDVPLPHTVTFTVTDLVKVIEGVPTRVMWNVDENEGEVVEAELAFFAQDDDGNVWNLGEYAEEYEEESFLGAPNTWIAGLADAEAGIHMPDFRDVGLTYLQGYAPEIDLLDCAEVVAEHVQECDIPAAPGDCFANSLLTHEQSPLDPDGGIETKYYAPGVGVAKAGSPDDPEGETLVLVEHAQLGQESMAAVREEALNLDRRAYRVSEVYCETEPIAPNPPAQCAVGQPVAPFPDSTAPPAPGSIAEEGTQTSQGSPAPATPAPAGPQRRSCYTKRRRARRVVTRRGSRILVKKMPRKLCAERLSRKAPSSPSPQSISQAIPAP
jgi:hypothetical protein